MFSQPSGTQSETGGQPDAGDWTLISMAAQLARTLGNPDGVRAQLLPHHHALFDMAYQVQGDRDGVEEESTLSRRTKEEVEKRRAARNAAQALADEERQALYAAADGDTDTFGLLSSMQLDELPEAEPLVENFLVKESVVRLYGPPKTYKSFVMLDLAACVGAGMPWCGNKTVQSKVLYVVAEGVRGIKRRVRAWEAHNKRAMTGVYFYDRAVQLGDRKDVSRLIATAKRGGFEFIILDTQARCTVGLEENSPTDMGLVVATLDVLKEVTGACVALVHHSGVAGGRARGSTAILGAVDAEFEVEAEKDTMTVSVHTRAQKDLAEARSVEFDLCTPGPGMSLAVRPRVRGQWYQARPEDLAPISEAYMNVLRGVQTFGTAGATESQLAKHLGEDVVPVKQALGQMHPKGLVFRKGSSWYLDRVGKLHLSGTLDSARED